MKHYRHETPEHDGGNFFAGCAWALPISIGMWAGIAKLVVWGMS